MAADAEGELLIVAEEADGHVIGAAAACGRKCNLVRPVTINRAFAELAFAIDHGTAPRLVAARARRYLPGEGRVRGACGRLEAA